jgi:hypothetical protein
MLPAFIALGIVAAVLLSAAPARADTLRREKRPIAPQAWHGCGEPPAEMRPRPRFNCGDKVVDTSTGKPRARRVSELSGSQDKAGGWHWAYILDDGTAASNVTLKRSEAQ